MRTADLPAFNDYGMRGRTYKFSEIEPLYPFGFGLGYAKLEYGPVTLSGAELKAGGKLVARTTLRNLSDRPVTESVQCYAIPPRLLPESPRAVLVDFQRVSVAAGATAPVEFRLGASAFEQFGASGQRAHAPGTYQVTIGSASPGKRAVSLGAPSPVTATVKLI
jgi:beta-glucosidase